MKQKKHAKKIGTLWGSAFSESPDEVTLAYTSGRDVVGVPAADQRLLPYDIWLNQAHCVMLYKQKIISHKDAQVILRGLAEIDKLAPRGQFVLDPTKEDVHTNIESWLTQKYGVGSAGKLHTARSRNDQATTDVRLYLRDQIVNFINSATALVDELIKQAGKHQKTVMPGFTHHQHAMITTWGHMLIAYVSMLLRDVEKFKAVYGLIDENMLGNAAAYGTSFPIDKDLTTRYFGFSQTDLNSIDAVMNRWEPEADLAYCITSLMNHLSSLSQTLILLSTAEFGMVQLADQYSTGSSIMPQKKNPDTLEATKAKASMAAGYLQSLISMGRASFIGYNRDDQWSKYLIMDAVDECLPAPIVMTGIIKTLKVNKENMKRWSARGFVGATTLLEMMCATWDIPFRQGKIVLEKAIKYSKDKDIIEFAALQKALKEEKVHVAISKEQSSAWQDPDEIIKLYKSVGSPGLVNMRKAILQTSQKNHGNKKWLKKMQSRLEKAQTLLDSEVKKILE